MKPAFTLGDAWELFRRHVPVRPSLEDALLGDDQNLRVLRDAILEVIRAEAARRVDGRGHQADIDARRLAAMWSIIGERRARMGAVTYGDLSHFAG